MGLPIFCFVYGLICLISPEVVLTLKWVFVAVILDILINR